MDIAQLEALGITKEDLSQRIVDQAVDSLLNYSGFDPEEDRECRYETRFKKEVQERLQKAVDDKIAALADIHLIPKVGEMIENANLRTTNRYGEDKVPPMTFIEYIAQRAENYMCEPVDISGKTKGENSYNWNNAGPRITVLMRNYIQSTLETHAKNALKDVNKVFADAIQNAAKDAITKAAATLKVSIS